MPVNEVAYAKINLALHVRECRDDGYHSLETLFAFVDTGDLLELEPSGAFSLMIAGGDGLSAGPDNLVTRAAALMGVDDVAIRLDKRLPISAGLGGGSADAAAAIRLIDRWQNGGDGRGWIERAATLGADVPACLLSETCVGLGTGTELEPLTADDLTGTPVLLVNPRVPLATGRVFAAWDGIDRGPLPSGGARAMALAGRNDLEAPAIGLCPVVAEVLTALQAQEPWLARMSGSGASCFALFETKSLRDAAAERLAAAYPGWWQMRGCLR